MYILQFMSVIVLKTLQYLSELQDFLVIAFGRGTVVEIYFINDSGKL